MGRRGEPWTMLIGVLLTGAIAALIELLRGTPMHLPGPGVALVIAVACSTYVGGFLPGVTSCAIAICYSSWFHLHGPHTDPEAIRRFLDVAIGAPVVMLMMGLLRRRAARTLRTEADAAVARQYAMLFEEAGEPMLLSDSTHRYVFVNRRACEVSGYSREELLRMRVGDLVSSRSLQARPLAMDELRRDGELRIPRELVRRDGTTVQIEVTARRLADGGTLAILRDVSRERADMGRIEHALAQAIAVLDAPNGETGGAEARLARIREVLDTIRPTTPTRR